MGRRRRCATSGIWIVGLQALLLTGWVGNVEAQADVERAPRVSLSGGVSQFDLSGTGTAPTIAVRGSYPLNSVIRVEASLGWSRPEQRSQSGPNSLWTPEVQVQFAIPGRVSPYLGLGGGVAFETGRDTGGFDPGSRVTASGSGGIRVGVASGWELIGELRVRGIGDVFEGSAAEWTVGVSRAF